MSSTRDIRRRIKSVKNIQQITKAMKMVAAARLRKAQEKALASKPYTDKITTMLRDVAAMTASATHPLLETREVKRTGYLVIAADKGLAGAYSSNVIKEALPLVNDVAASGLNVVGRKVRDYFKRRDYKLEREYSGFSERPEYRHAAMLAEDMAQAFISGEYDEIKIVFTQFFSAGHFRPTVMRLLPLVTPHQETNAQPSGTMQEIIFEPSPEAVLELLLPKYLESVIYGALSQSAASELGARMMAMSSATDNAQELIAQLVLNYNKVRQANITREITEIVGGAEALK